MTQTTVTTLAAGNFLANRIGLQVPPLTGLTSWVFPRTSPPPANLIAGGPAVTNVGSGPALLAAWGNFLYSTAAYNSGVADSTQLTLMAVAESPGGSNGFTLFSNETPGGIDFSINQYTNAASIYVAGCCSTTMFVPLPGGSILDWAFYALTVGPAGVEFFCPTADIAWSLASIAVTGTPAAGNTLSLTCTGSFSGSPHTTTYTLLSTDTTPVIAAASFAAAINADATLIAAGITANASYVGAVGSITLLTEPGAGYTFAVGETGGGVAIATISPAAAHTVNATLNFEVGSTINGVGRGGGSVSWWGACTGPGSQATPALIQETYLAMQGGFAVDGIII